MQDTLIAAEVAAAFNDAVKADLLCVTKTKAAIQKYHDYVFFAELLEDGAHASQRDCYALTRELEDLVETLHRTIDTLGAQGWHVTAVTEEALLFTHEHDGVKGVYRWQIRDDVLAKL